MTSAERALFAVAVILCFAASAGAETLVRWDQSRIPSPMSLGLSTIVVPAKDDAVVRAALAQGYRLYLEIDASAVATFPLPASPIAGLLVKGRPTALQLRQLRQRAGLRGARVIALDERAKWPHIRSNWVTRAPQDAARLARQPSARKDEVVLQVTGRSAQPWIENNAALIRIAQAARPGSKDAIPMLTYEWQPITLSEVDEGPSLENYLVAIAEAGSFGGDLVLPLHQRFQQRLLAGQPQARAEWAEVRRYIEFYSWNLPATHKPIANIGVVTADPVLWFEVMNLLARHNLPFEHLAALGTRQLDGFQLLIVLGKPSGDQLDALANFERGGGTVVVAGVEGKIAGLQARVYNAISDPNAFALEMRQLLGRERRVVDIWNGITVLAAPYRNPDGGSVLITALNYSYQPLPVQLRIPGTFSTVYYESPEEPAALLPHQQREGHTEFVLPALRVGGRVFLSR